MSNSLILPFDVGQVSDGYHTFDELYEHRCLLWANILNSNTENSFKTWLNDKGEKYDGWFIAGMDSEYGQLTYHLPERFWPLLNVKILNNNSNYDGHTSADVAERLLKMLSRK